MNRFSHALTLAASLAAGLVGSGTTHAAINQWDYTGAYAGGVGPGNGSGASSATPWISSPAAGSSYAEWNFFVDTDGGAAGVIDNTPDIAGIGNLAEGSTGFVTGSLNIYSFSTALSLTSSLAGGGSGLYDVWLRISTFGTAPSPSATLNGVAANAVTTFSGSESSSMGPVDAAELLWTWQLPAAATYSFQFAGTESSLSLDQAAMYAAPAAVPEPETFVMLLAGMGMVAGIARRRLSNKA